MLLGEIPGLALDRTGVALLGALALVATERVTPAAAWAAVDVPTIALLFGLMVVSAQFRLGGFYTWVTRRIVSAPLGPSALLAAVVVVAGVLSALLANDIVCLAVAPLLLEGCARRGLDPRPLPAGPRLRLERRLGGDPHRQPAEHAHRPDAAAVLRRVPRRCAGARPSRPRAGVGGRPPVGARALGDARPPCRRSRPRRSTAGRRRRARWSWPLLVLGFLFTPVPREVLALGAAAACC